MKTLTVPIKKKTVTKPLFEDVAVYRIQLIITTGRGNDAGTDTGLSVQFNDNGSRFWLSKGIDDNFKEGSTVVYDVLTTSVRKIGDIDFIRFCNKGDDGIAIKKVKLLINNCTVPIFEIEDPGRGMVTDDEKPFTFPGAQLRKHPGWAHSLKNKAILQVPDMISREMITSLIEAAIGHQITAVSGLGWGTKSKVGNTKWGEAVELKFISSKKVHVDLDLKQFLGGPNPELDVDFDLVFSCENGVINLVTENLETGTNYVGEAQKLVRAKLIPELCKALGKYLGEEETGTFVGGLLGNFLAFNLNFTPANPALSHACTLIRIDSNCNIHLR